MPAASKPRPLPTAIRGARVQLRSLRRGDIEPLFHCVDRDRKDLARWLPWVKLTQSPEDTAQFVQAKQLQRRRKQAFAYTLREGRELRGVVEIFRVDAEQQSGEIGYWQAVGARGRGLMTEAVAQLTSASYQCLKLDRLVIKCDVHNAASAAIAERLGFQFEGVERHGLRVGNRPFDFRVFSLLRGEVAARRKQWRQRGWL